MISLMTFAPVPRSSVGIRLQWMTWPPSNTSWDTTVTIATPSAPLFPSSWCLKCVSPSDYKNDPYSEGDPCKSICCRNDLRELHASPGGCYDTKVRMSRSRRVCVTLTVNSQRFCLQVTDLHMAQEFEAEAVNGPTTDGDLPVFSWEKFNSTLHQGLPQLYNFSFISMQPQLFRPWCWTTTW